MKRYLWLIFGILGLLAVVVVAYLWSMGMMDSMYTYRSPLQTSSPATGEPLGESLTGRLVFVLIDALREDTSLDEDVMPFLNELRQQGAWATMHSQPPSFSDPGYTTLLTGAWPDINDCYPLNPSDEDIRQFTQDDIFSAAHRVGLKTAISGYEWFKFLIPQEAVDASFYTLGEDETADREVVDAALPWLQDTNYQFIFIHLNQVDYAGHHEGGPRDPRWDAAASRVDDLLREMASYLDFDQDTLLVVSDHGQIDIGGHGGQDPDVLVEPFVLVGSHVSPGEYDDIQMVDVAPTISTLLGASIPASDQGHVLSTILEIPPRQSSALTQALETQQGQLFQAYTTAIDKTVQFEKGEDVVTSTQAAIQSARAQRLARERIWRGLIALWIAAIPAVILILKRNKRTVWFLGGALLFLLLFNARYVLLDNRTYSLSSVISETDLIMYNGITAAIAFLVAWLVVMLATGGFRNGARIATQTALSLIWMTLYLLSLPILLSYAVNGVAVTWTLPDFTSMFFGFISLLQSLLVAAVGLILTGLSAFIGWAASKIKK